VKSSGNDPNTLAILYAEDEADARELLSSVLTMKYPDVRLHLAETGQMGLELFRAHRPGIVITDINMPMMDGIQMSGEIKALEPETVIIALTAHSDTKYLLNAIEIGIHSVGTNPSGSTMSCFDVFGVSLRVSMTATASLPMFAA